MKENVNEMINLRKHGLTYAQIGEEFGISRQRVHQLIGKERARKCDTNIEEIAYEGIYQLFVDDPEMTFTKLTKIMYGTIAAESASCEKVYRFVRKKANSRMTLDCINNLIRYIGKTYEEVFKERITHENNH